MKSKAFEQTVAAQRQLQDRINRTKESYILKRNISIRIFKNMDTDIQYSKFRKESFLIGKRLLSLLPNRCDSSLRRIAFPYADKGAG
ncbi:hypothetical protein ACWF5S_09585 [Peribacillus butanolivorans]